MAEALVKEVGIDDLYGFLGVPADASDKEVGPHVVGILC